MVPGVTPVVETRALQHHQSTGSLQTDLVPGIDLDHQRPFLVLELFFSLPPAECVYPRSGPPQAASASGSLLPKP